MKMRKILASVLAIIIVFSLCGTAFAAQEFVDGQIIVRLNSDVTAENGYESLFPELELERVVERVVSSSANKVIVDLVLELKDKTDEAVYEAIELLEDNQYVSLPRVNGFQYYIGKNLTGDVDRNGSISNVDMVILARGLLGTKELSDDERLCADMNGDGRVSNADLVRLARKLISFTEPVEIGEEMENQMIRDFWMYNSGRNYYSDNVLEYLGTYSGCEVVYMGGSLSAFSLNTIEIGEYTFKVPARYCSLLIYKDSVLMPIKDAYEEKWITDADLADIYEKNDELIAELAAKNEIRYGDEEKHQAMIAEIEANTTVEYDSMKMDAELSIAYSIYVNNTRDWVLDIKYYGTYNGCDIASVDENILTLGVVVNVDAAGYWFSFGSPAKALYVYKDNEFLRIDEAYKAGWITEEDVAAIWELNGGSF